MCIICIHVHACTMYIHVYCTLACISHVQRTPTCVCDNDLKAVNVFKEILLPAARTYTPNGIHLCAQLRVYLPELGTPV